MNKKVLIFGDSFIGPFNLLKQDNLVLKKFKGATMKGLTKPEHPNRQTIKKIVKRYKNITRCLIFIFGNVDFNFSIYYTKIVQKKSIDLDDMIEKYTSFISNLDSPGRKIVFNVFPSAIDDDNIIGSLKNYGIINEKELDTLSDDTKKKISDFGYRFKYFKKITEKLEEECKKKDLLFIDFQDNLLDNNNRMLRKYIDPESIYNIHVLWEPIIKLLVDRLNQCGLKKYFKQNLEKSFRGFVADKKEKIKKKYSLIK